MNNLGSSEPKKSRGGMAGLAADLSSRAGSLAHRSTEERLVPMVSESAPISDPEQSTPPESRPLATPNPVVAPSEAAPDSTSSVRPSTRSSAVVRRPARPAPSRGLGHPLAGPEGRLEASGEAVVKMTLELAPQLIMALNVWERDETKRLGQRVFRERMIDLALDCLPEDVDSIVELVALLPAALRHAPGQQFGTRVRASVRDKLLGLRPELRVAGVKNVRIRDVYSAGVYRYLVGLGISVEDPAAVATN